MEFAFIIVFTVLAVLILQIILIILLLSKNRRDSGGEVLRKLVEYDQRLDRSESSLRSEFRENREDTNRSAKESREELSKTLNSSEEKLTGLISGFTGIIDNKMKHIQELLELGLKNSREELNNTLKAFEEKSSTKIEALTRDTREGLDKSRETVEKKLAEIQNKNDEKLEQMRRTVDEKLQTTLEKRLNDSFQLVSTQLDSVQKGLGEMQNLAAVAGDLKKVLTIAPSRGEFGEIQLGAILEKILSSDQYEKQKMIKENSGGRVDYVIKLPNRSDRDEPLLLPVDSKFPTADYQRLLDAYENRANLPQKEAKDEIKARQKEFESTVKNFAKDIKSKYIDNPRTTDFAFMFVPTEGLFAEILRMPGLFETLRLEYNIIVVGPTNFAAVLGSLQIGFQTLAIELRSKEIWKTLGAVKTAFNNLAWGA